MFKIIDALRERGREMSIEAPDSQRKEHTTGAFIASDGHAQPPLPPPPAD